MSPMGPGLRQELRQILAPEMLQLLKLLQLPTLELQQLVRQELEINPMLEEVLEQETEEQQESSAAADSDPYQKSLDEEAEEKQAPDKIDWENYLQEGLDSGYYPQQQKSEESREFYGVIQQSFQEYVMSQLRISCGEEESLRVGTFLVGNLNDDGYLGIGLDEAALSLNMPVPVVEKMLQVIQTFDPPGVGARDLRECLLIQLEQMGYRESLAWRIVENHLDDLERRRYQSIARSLKVAEEEIIKARELISNLSPKPGTGYSSEETRYIYPDIIIEKQDGDYVIIINDRVVPRVKITSDYKKILMRSKKARPEEREYVVKRLEAARFIIRMIEQRRRTMQRIMQAIVERQRSFLDNGLRHLKPLTMKQIADDIEMHESTVSRAVHNKYALTPNGLVAVRYFFGGGIKSDTGEDSVKAIKDKIAEMIRNEPPRDPLSDQDITEAFAKNGVKIARRTVAKYRQEEKILPANLRRKS
jgi:RNA polymerase sigma-54 factor